LSIGQKLGKNAEENPDLPHDFIEGSGKMAEEKRRSVGIDLGKHTMAIIG